MHARTHKYTRTCTRENTRTHTDAHTALQVSKVLDQAKQYDTSKASESAIQAAHATLSLLSAKGSRSSRKRADGERKQRPQSQIEHTSERERLGKIVLGEGKASRVEMGMDLPPRPHTRQGTGGHGSAGRRVSDVEPLQVQWEKWHQRKWQEQQVQVRWVVGVVITVVVAVAAAAVLLQLEAKQWQQQW